MSDKFYNLFFFFFCLINTGKYIRWVYLLDLKLNYFGKRWIFVYRTTHIEITNGHTKKSIKINTSPGSTIFSISYFLIIIWATISTMFNLGIYSYIVPTVLYALPVVLVFVVASVDIYEDKYEIINMFQCDCNTEIFVVESPTRVLYKEAICSNTEAVSTEVISPEATSSNTEAVSTEVISTEATSSLEPLII